MVSIKTTIKTCLAAIMLLASNAFADGLSWEYFDVLYQQPSNDDTQGFAAEGSGHIAKNWVLQSRVSRLHLKDSAIDLEMSQTRFDLSVGRVIALSNKFAALVSAGYTRLEYETEVAGFKDKTGDDTGNVQLGLRTSITDKFEAEASVGMLFDDKDTSDLLWNAKLRYRAYPSLSFLIGASGINNEVFDSDDILYEIGFRFGIGEN